jgi:hypothetical protein
MPKDKNKNQADPGGDQDVSGVENEEGFDLPHEERLPWLEPADDYQDGDAVSPSRLLLLVVGGLLLIGAVIGGLWWVQNGGTRGDAQLIAAQDGDYKVAPESDNAKVFEGEGDASFAATEGAELESRIDPSRLPEEPAVIAQAQAAKAEKDKAAAKAEADKKTDAKPDAVKAAPAAAAGAGAVQLGAFSSEASASKAWASLSKRFSFLADLNKSVTPVAVDGGTVYRLRAAAGSAANATALCGKLRVAGENCVVVR